MFGGGQDAHPTREFILCGTGILPVLEKGKKYQLKLIGENQSFLICLKSGILSQLAS